MSSVEDDRAKRAVSAAVRVFGHGTPAAEWLGCINPALGDRAPLLVARESDNGLVRVLDMLDQLGSARNN